MKKGGSKNNEKVLTANEVASRLRIHPYTVYKLLKDGTLRGFQLRRRWRVKETDLQDFMSSENNKEILA